jgi:hypothetical protein
MHIGKTSSERIGCDILEKRPTKCGGSEQEGGGRENRRKCRKM